MGRNSEDNPAMKKAQLQLAEALAMVEQLSEEEIAKLLADDSAAS